MVERLVEAERPYAPHFDEAAARARARPGGNALATSPRRRSHGRQDLMFPPTHGRALAAEIPGAELLLLDGMGHEHLPPHTWDIAVPAILRHTA